MKCTLRNNYTPRSLIFIGWTFFFFSSIISLWIWNTVGWKHWPFSTKMHLVEGENTVCGKKGEYDKMQLKYKSNDLQIHKQCYIKLFQELIFGILIDQRWLQSCYQVFHHVGFISIHFLLCHWLSFIFLIIFILFNFTALLYLDSHYHFF